MTSGGFRKLSLHIIPRAIILKPIKQVGDISPGKSKLFWHFLVVPDLSEELIIGADFLQRWKVKLDPENERIIIDPEASKLKLV